MCEPTLQLQTSANVTGLVVSRPVSLYPLGPSQGPGARNDPDKQDSNWFSDDPTCYELKVNSIETGVSVKSSTARSRSLPSRYLQLSFRRIMHTHMLQRLFETCSTQRIQLLPSPAYTPDMSLIEHVWDLVD
ncbi:hypothetical protein TNCV_3363241 [Trichonephila clavipes]|nr:hypothetical protein TNCV_3363241 [Trichonephila clavipes]